MKTTNYQMASLLSQSQKFTTIHDIIANIDCICEIIKIDIEQIISKKRETVNFDDYFKVALSKLKRNLREKQHLKGIQRILSETDMYRVLRIIIIKLSGMVRNEYNPTRKNSLAQYYNNFTQTEYNRQTQKNDTLDMIIREENEKEHEVNVKNCVEDFYKMIESGEIGATNVNGHQQLLMFAA